MPRLGELMMVCYGNTLRNANSFPYICTTQACKINQCSPVGAWFCERARQEEERTWQPAHSEGERHQHAGSQSPAAARLCYPQALVPCIMRMCEFRAYRQVWNA